MRFRLRQGLWGRASRSPSQHPPKAPGPIMGFRAHCKCLRMQRSAAAQTSWSGCQGCHSSGGEQGDNFWQRETVLRGVGWPLALQGRGGAALHLTLVWVRICSAHTLPGVAEGSDKRERSVHPKAAPTTSPQTHFGPWSQLVQRRPRGGMCFAQQYAGS